MNPINVTASVVVAVLGGFLIGWAAKAMYDERRAR